MFGPAFDPHCGPWCGNSLGLELQYLTVLLDRNLEMKSEFACKREFSVNQLE